MITFTESAAAKLADLLKTQAKPEEGLRVRADRLSRRRGALSRDDKG